MKQTFKELALATNTRQTNKSGSVLGEQIAQAEQMKKYFTPYFEGARPGFKELMTVADFPLLYRRIEDDILRRPVEPEYIGISLFAKTLVFTSSNPRRFPTLGAITAHDVVPNQPIPREDLVVDQKVIEMGVKRSGVGFDLDPELLDESFYDLAGLLTESARAALLRHKEKKVYNAVMEGAFTIFDNASADPAAWTGGRAEGGKTRNGSLTFDDMVEMLVQPMLNNYSVTDIVNNPLAWSILYRDPILRAQFMTMGQVGNQIWSKKPGIDNQAITPWGINYVYSRFLPVSFNKTVNTGLFAGTGAVTDRFVDVLMVDRNNPVIIAQREAIQSRSFEDPELEIQSLLFQEKYSVYANDAERSAVIARNVRLVQNFQAVVNVGMVTP